MDRPQTVGELRAAGYRVAGVKDEMRRNLIRKLRANEPLFPGIVGYDDSVIPQIQNAVLARHDLLLLGLRGQAKTRLLRGLVALLDDAVPILRGGEVNDNPFTPISHSARELAQRLGDGAPVEWVGREGRYLEKLATPDVTVADLLGEIDLVRHAAGRRLSDEAILHFGLLPRANRGLFCINELPDLAPKVQVALFNVLEERDVQIRGFPVRLPLDVCLVFSANPEDYTSRGRIVTPLKDRIGSVVRTHYPPTRAQGVAAAEANAWLERDGVRVVAPFFMKEIVEETTRQARASAAVNQQSGVSVRMSIANCELLVSAAERRALALGEATAAPRVSDLWALTAGSRGKIELALAEEDADEDQVVEGLLAAAVRAVFADYWDLSTLRPVVGWFTAGGRWTVGDRAPLSEYARQLRQAGPVRAAVDDFLRRTETEGEAATASAVEFLLEGLHLADKLIKKREGGATVFHPHELHGERPA